MCLWTDIFLELNVEQPVLPIEPCYMLYMQGIYSGSTGRWQEADCVCSPQVSTRLHI